MNDVTIRPENTNSEIPVGSPPAPIWDEPASVKPPRLLTLIAISMFLPEEASFLFGELRMTVVRLLFLIISPLVVWRFVQLIVRGRYRFIWSDALVPIAGLWMFVGPMSVDGFDRALTYCGSSALEFCVPYMAARVFLVERGQAAALVRTLCITIAVVGFLSILDEISGRFLVREIVAAIPIFGRKASDDVDFFGYDNPDLMRGFLFRASSTLDHPILLGTACLLGLFMATTLRGGLRQFSLLGSAVGLVLSVSSAPIGGAVMGLGVFFYEKITRNVPYRWRLLFAGCAIPITVIFIGHPDPLSFFLNHMSLQPGTAYYRVLQWDCAGGLVLNSPIIGLGMSNDWASYCEIAKTIDSFWLREAMLYGIPGAILTFLCYVTACSLPGNTRRLGPNLSEQERRLIFVLTLTLGLVIWIGFTVHFWGAMYILAVFLTGIRAHIGALAAETQDTEL
jgi:hypothetical protein